MVKGQPGARDVRADRLGHRRRRVPQGEEPGDRLEHRGEAGPDDEHVGDEGQREQGAEGDPDDGLCRAHEGHHGQPDDGEAHRGHDEGHDGGRHPPGKRWPVGDGGEHDDGQPGDEGDDECADDASEQQGRGRKRGAQGSFEHPAVTVLGQALGHVDVGGDRCAVDRHRPRVERAERRAVAHQHVPAAVDGGDDRDEQHGERDGEEHGGHVTPQDRLGVCDLFRDQGNRARGCRAPGSRVGGRAAGPGPRSPGAARGGRPGGVTVTVPAQQDRRDDGPGDAPQRDDEEVV